MRLEPHRVYPVDSASTLTANLVQEDECTRNNSSGGIHTVTLNNSQFAKPFHETKLSFVNSQDESSVIFRDLD